MDGMNTTQHRKCLRVFILMLNVRLLDVVQFFVWAIEKNNKSEHESDILVSRHVN